MRIQNRINDATPRLDDAIKIRSFKGFTGNFLDNEPQPPLCQQINGKTFVIAMRARGVFFSEFFDRLPHTTHSSTTRADQCKLSVLISMATRNKNSQVVKVAPCRRP